ncbi:hypothetical protein [Streptomyces fulvoviolaceus]|uniref:hypothetical protein n=1 Tax=Streptomyces fulvoviolaceus TaxID=285535 RepID=UPI0005BB32B5|nr:hypothetical protein [Streptomyces fulvoviolaceus]
MADEQYKWLDRETAERLLCGESLEAVDAADRDRAERLATTLGALTAETPPTSGELPGEAAALAAFRKVRAERADDWVGDWAGERTRGRHRARPHSSDAGLVRIDRAGGPDADDPRPRRRRPARFALVATLAVGMVGGVAVAAGTGVLPTPFGDGEPDPVASVSAAVTPDRPLASPSPMAPESEPTPDGATSGSSAGAGSPRDTARGGTATDPGTGSAREDVGHDWSGAASACRDVRDGKDLTADRMRDLQGAAGGSTHVWKYCKGVLADTDTTGEDANDRGGDRSDTGDSDGESGQTDENGQGDKDDQGTQGAGQNSRFMAPGGTSHDRADGAGDTPLLSLLSGRATMSESPMPSPTYSAL